MNSKPITCEVAGHCIAALHSAARGPNVVFMPGITASISLWRDVLPSDLQHRYNWLSLSLPCHFPSVAPNDFKASDMTMDLFLACIAAPIRTVFGDEPVHLVGWSTGGHVAFAYAARNPHGVATVTSIAGFARGRWGDKLGLLQWMALRGFLGRITCRCLLRVLQRSPFIFRQVYSSFAADRRYVRASSVLTKAWPRIAADFAAMNVAQLTNMFAMLARADLSSSLSSLEVPAFVIGGARDRIVDWKETTRLAALLPSSTLRLFDDCGHIVFAESPESLWQCVDQWIQQHELP